MNRLLALSCFPFILVSAASAQERVDVFSIFGQEPKVEVLEVNAGAIMTTGVTLLQPLTPFPLTSAECATRVGTEYWVGTHAGLIRYQRDPFTYIGTAYTDVFVRSITPTSTGALLTGNREVVEVDFAGVELRRLTTGLREFNDVLPIPSGYLAAMDTGIRHLNTNFGLLGDFGVGAGTIANQNGYGYLPSQLRLLSSGRIAVGAFACIVILESDGTVYGVANGGPLELDIIETGGGMLLIPSAQGLGLMDPDSLEFFPRSANVAGATGKCYSRSYSAPAPTVSGRTCSTTVNSTGEAGRLHLLASPELTRRKLSLVGTGLPQNSFSLSFFSQHTQNVAHGDGRLCLSTLGSTLRRGPVASTSATGTTRTDFDFLTTGLGAGFTAGTTWHFQILFRDTGPSGFNGTDSVYVTFEP